MTKLEGVALAAVIGAVPTCSMAICSLVANRVKVKPEIEAIFQNFAAGLIIAAVAAELFPLLSKSTVDNSNLPKSIQIGGVTIGFVVALCMIYGLEHFISVMKEAEEDKVLEITSADALHDGVELTAMSKVNNEDFYKKIADAHGVELDVTSLGTQGTPLKSSAKSSDSKEEESPPAAAPPRKNTLEIAELGENGGVAVVVKEDDEEDATDKRFIGFGLNSHQWDEQGLAEASRAISDPKHRAHVVEHVQELVAAVRTLQAKTILITDGRVTATTEGGKKELTALPLKESDQLAEEMDMGVHNLQYLLDHCRRLLQGTEFEFEGETEAPLLLSRMDDAKKAQMKRRVHVLVLAAEHILEHVTEHNSISSDILQEVYMHMDEMEKHLEFFHDSVQHVASRWSRRDNLPTPELGDYLPIGLIVPVTMDCFTDGLLIGVACALKAEAGIILGFANCLEMGFLGIAYSWRLGKCTGSSKIKRVAATYLPPLVMWAAAVLGGYIANSTRDEPLVFVSFVAFGVVALLFLVCNELLIEAREAQGEDGKWWISIWVFVAVWLVLVMAPLIAE